MTRGPALRADQAAGGTRKSVGAANLRAGSTVQVPKMSRSAHCGFCERNAPWISVPRDIKKGREVSLGVALGRKGMRARSAVRIDLHDLEVNTISA